MFILLLRQGQAGETWEPSNVIILFLPSPKYSVSHFFLVFRFRLLFYYIILSLSLSLQRVKGNWKFYMWK